MSEAINKYYIEDGNLQLVNTCEQIDSSSNGKTIYEVLRVIDGKPIFLKEHLKRLEKSFTIIDENFQIPQDKIREYIEKLIKANNNIEGNIKIIYNTEDEALKVFYIKHSYPSKELYTKGIKTILYRGERDNPNAKIINTSFREIIAKELKEKDAYEALLVDRNNMITEGSKSNVFFIKGNTLITAPATKVLKGITREKVILVAQNLNIDIQEREFSYKELAEIDALFISGTSPKVLPIAMVGEIEYSVSNSVLLDIMNGYNQIISKEVGIL